jgi:hypothetical protein
MKYTLNTLNTKAVKSLPQVEALVADLLRSELGVEAEVTIREQVMVYTEELDKVEAIKGLMGQARGFVRESFYEADEDYPAGAALVFAL